MEKQKLSRLRSLQEKLNKMHKEAEPIMDELETLKLEKSKEQLSKYIGKCYKHKTGFGDDQWWVYTKVIDTIEHPSYLDAITCEIDYYGRTSIQTIIITTSDLDKKIRPATFDKVLKKCLENIKSAQK